MKKALLLATCLMFLPATAYGSDPTGAYVNIGLTQLSADLDLSDLDVQGTALDLGEQSADILMITARLGYRVFDYLAIEGESGFGFGGDDFSTVIPVDTDIGIIDVDTDVGVDVNSYAGIFARGILPVSDEFDLFIRGGYGTAEAEATATGSFAGLSASASESASIDGFAYGIGGQYNLNTRTGVRLDYTAIDGDTSVSIISGSVAFRF